MPIVWVSIVSIHASSVSQYCEYMPIVWVSIVSIHTSSVSQYCEYMWILSVPVVWPVHIHVLWIYMLVHVVWVYASIFGTYQYCKYTPALFTVPDWSTEASVNEGHRGDTGGDHDEVSDGHGPGRYQQSQCRRWRPDPQQDHPGQNTEWVQCVPWRKSACGARTKWKSRMCGEVKDTCADNDRERVPKLLIKSCKCSAYRVYLRKLVW